MVVPSFYECLLVNVLGQFPQSFIKSVPKQKMNLGPLSDTIQSGNQLNQDLLLKKTFATSSALLVMCESIR